MNTDMDSPFSPQSGAFDPARWREHLSAYLDGELPAGDARRFLGWLESNPAAWKDAEEARRVWALLSAYADEPVPEGFAERVMTAATGGDSAGRSTGPQLRVLAGGRLRAIAVAAAVVVAVGAGVFVLRPRAPEVADVSASAALDAVPAELLESENLASLASLSDEEFEALLAVDPEALTVDSSKKSGG
jgi:anti-sigma factor RsiW